LTVVAWKNTYSFAYTKTWRHVFEYPLVTLLLISIAFLVMGTTLFIREKVESRCKPALTFRKSWIRLMDEVYRRNLYAGVYVDPCACFCRLVG